MSGKFIIEWTKDGTCELCDSLDGENDQCCHGWNIKGTNNPDLNLCWGPGEYDKPGAINYIVMPAIDPLTSNAMAQKAIITLQDQVRELSLALHHAQNKRE